MLQKTCVYGNKYIKACSYSKHELEWLHAQTTSELGLNQYYQRLLDLKYPCTTLKWIMSLALINWLFAISQLKLSLMYVVRAIINGAVVFS